jgi:undecaprenyl diphosphate synthase
MDGNRRWAKERGISTLKGHTEGLEAFKRVVRYVRDDNIPHAVFYTFSTENWKRSKLEVDYLLTLLKGGIKELLIDIDEEKVRVRFVGNRNKFSKKLQTLIRELEEKSAQYKKTTVWVCLSYGGRQEILEAVNKAVEKGTKVTEKAFGNLLQTAEMPDPDMIVRTSGERRLSNFLPWQAVYSELFFVDTYWPDFGKKDFRGILEAYAKRERRNGK